MNRIEAAKAEGLTMTIFGLMDKIDWALLAKEKLVLLSIKGNNPTVDGALAGIINLIDALQDVASEEGYPVVWLEGIEQ